MRLQWLTRYQRALFDLLALHVHLRQATLAHGLPTAEVLRLLTAALLVVRDVRLLTAQYLVVEAVFCARDDATLLVLLCGPVDSLIIVLVRSDRRRLGATLNFGNPLVA